MNTIYKEKTDYSSRIDSKEVASRYQEYINEIAKCLSKLSEIRDHISYLHDITEDNGDVAIQLDTAILELGKALAIACNYREEYQEETNS